MKVAGHGHGSPEEQRHLPSLEGWARPRGAAGEQVGV